MSEGVWVALIMGVPTVLALVGGALAWAINLVSSQSKDTIAALKEERDYWRKEAQDCRVQRKEGS
jgi:hypothetical protein